jgi:hypothetical protein
LGDASALGLGAVAGRRSGVGLGVGAWRVARVSGICPRACAV